MVQRPPFDRNNPPPGGFRPRLEGEQEFERRGPDPQYRPREPQASDEPDPFDRDRRPPLRDDRGARKVGPNRWLWIVGGLLILGAVLFGLSLSRSGPGSDALGTDSEGKGEEAAAEDPASRCAAPATYELIKRELFRQAATTRGSDQAAFDQLAAYSSLRVTKPVLREQDQGLERVSCQADVSLDLPPGVQVVGGRRTLTAGLGYNLLPAADGSGDVVTLSGAEAIVVPLATLARSGSASPTPATEMPGGPEVIVPPTTPSTPQPIEESGGDEDTAEPSPSPATVSARPSFNCARARTRGEIAVCNSSELASLDRQMASFYGSAYRSADPEARALLERTRSRFLGYRDRCRSDDCVADAYRGRISEIRDIADGRWRGQ